MNKALLVSAWQPTRSGAAQSGLYRRLSIMIDAIKKNYSLIEALFYLRPDSENLAGNQVREIEQNLSQLWGVNVQVSLCPRLESRNASSVYDYCKSSTSFFRLPGYRELSGESQVAAFEDCLTRNPDAVFIHRLQCMTPLMVSQRDLPPVFFDLDDIEHIAMLRHLSQPPYWWRKNLAYLYLPALLWGERQAIKLSKATFVCSEIDRNKVASLFRTKNVVAIPNAVPLPNVTDPSPEPRILMLGNYEYAPNRLGAEFFLDQVWPSVSSAFPAAEVVFAGHKVEAIQHYAHPPQGVLFPEFVDDLEDLYRRTRIVICPILSGGGTRVKIMEAAAYGRPVVSTTMGVEGIDLIDQREVLLSDTSENFADACVKLLSDYKASRLIGAAARKAVESKYEREKIVAKVAGILSHDMNDAKTATFD